MPLLPSGAGAVRVPRVAPAVLALTGACLYLALGLGVFVVTSNDFFGTTWRSDQLRWSDLNTWVNPFYQVGFPALLRLLWGLTSDHLISARLINAVAAGIALAALWTLAYRLHPRAWPATIATIAIGLSQTFIIGVRTESGDMLMAAASLWALALMLGPRTRRRTFAVGVCLGLAFLFRSHALVMVVIVIAIGRMLDGVADGASDPRPQATDRQRTVWLVVGFLLAASPQVIANAIVTGNPFYNRQSINVGIGVWGVDWYNFPQSTAAYTLRYVLTHDVLALAKSWFYTLDEYLSNHDALAAAFALPLWLVGGRSASSVRAALFLAMTALLYVSALSIGFYLPRAAVLPAALSRLLLFVAAARWLAHVEPAPTRRLTAAFLALALGGLLMFDLIRDGRAVVASRAFGATNLEVSQVLHAHGVTDPREVLSSSFNYYYAFDRRRRPFYNYGGWPLLEPTYAAAYPRPTVSDVASLQTFTHAHGICFLLLDFSAARAMPQIAAAAADGSLAVAFAPVWHDDALTLWQRRSCAMPVVAH